MPMRLRACARAMYPSPRSLCWNGVCKQPFCIHGTLVPGCRLAVTWMKVRLRTQPSRPPHAVGNHLLLAIA
eukprot:3092785-Amphidinium_carterae.1